MNASDSETQLDAAQAASSGTKVTRASFPSADVSEGGKPGPTTAQQSANGSSEILPRFFDVSFTVSVELGRRSMPLGELTTITTGSIIPLNKPISEPVDLFAQGVQIASGEVVVVDGRFAIRITEVTNRSGR